MMYDPELKIGMEQIDFLQSIVLFITIESGVSKWQ